MMNQQINLYLPEFRVKKDALTALLMAQILGGVVVVLVLASAYRLFEQWQLGNELAGQRDVLATETAKTDQLGNQLAGRSEDQALQNRLERAEVRLESSRQIRDFLSRTQLGNVEGFSQHFKDLARARVDGLSIAGFTISGGGSNFSLTGEVIDSNLVPRYVANLGGGVSSLKNLRFNPSISRAEPSDRAFTFSLSSGDE